MTGMEPPQPVVKPVPILSDNDLERLIRACQGKTFVDRRDEALVRVLLDCGIRVSELCDLRADGVDRDRETTIVRGKGGRLRPVYFGARTARALDRYLR